MFERIIRNIDNQLYQNKSEEEIKAEKAEKKEKLMKEIKEVLFPQWENQSKVSIKREDKIKLWEELLENLYYCKAFNIKSLYGEIKYIRERVAMYGDNWNNKRNI